jgi:hypothetical protein
MFIEFPCHLPYFVTRCSSRRHRYGLWESNDHQAQAMITMFIHADMQHLQKDTYVAFIGPSANLHPSLSKDLWDQLNTLSLFCWDYRTV